MTPESACALYRRWINEVWNGSPEKVGELVSEDFVAHWPGNDIRGTHELAEVISSTRAMFTSPYFRIELGPFSDGEFVAGRWSGSGGTEEGEKRFGGNDILRVRDGRLVEYWVASFESGPSSL